MWRPGLFEVIIVLVIIVLLFGPGRIAKVAKEIGASITAFKEGLQSGTDENNPSKNDDQDAANSK